MSKASVPRVSPLRPPSPSRRAAIAFAIIATALGSAACRRRATPEQQQAAWERARAELTSGEHCLAGRADYCLTDPAFVDAAIQPRLDELYGGEMPPRKMHIDAVIRAGAIRYKRAMMQPDNLLKVEELVKERYFAPKVTETEDIVSIDVGVTPGILQGHPATLTLSLQSSDVMDRGEWKRSELERVLGDALTKYPDKQVVRVVVTALSDRGFGPVSYRWLRATKTLVISDWQHGMRTTKRLTGESALKDPSTPLRFFDLTPCEAAQLAPPADQDPPKLCPFDVDPAAPAPGG